ncbi:MAG: MFS transporter [Alphaproteobacteria bacterium]|nr:MFS transporter [Alphaproteobacteria bacterium]
MIQNTNWRAVLAVLAAGIAMAMHVGKVPPAVALVRADLGLGLIAVGWLLSLFALIGAGLGSVVGGVVDRFGQKKALLFGLAATVLGSLLGGLLADGPVLLLLSRALEGVGLVSVIVAAPALIWRDTISRDQRLAFGLWSTWMPAGAALMMALSPLLLAEFGWRANWLTAGSLTLAAFVLALICIGPDAPAAQRPRRGGLKEVVKLPAAWILALSFCFYSMSFQTVFGFLPSYLIDQQQLDAPLAARLTALAILVNVVGNLSAGWLIRLGLARWQVIALACLAMGLCAWGIFSETLPMPARYGFCLAFSGIGGVIPAVIFIAAPGFAPTPRHVATIGGVIVQGLSLGQLTGPPVLAFLVERWGSWSIAPVFLSALAGLGIILALALGRLERLRA